MFVKRDDAGGGGANRGGGGGDGGGGDGSQGNDRKQLKGGESESRTSSTRQPHASSPPLLRPEPTKHVHLGQLASGRQEAPRSSTRTSLFSSRNRRIQCRRRRAIPNDYRRIVVTVPRSSTIGYWLLLIGFGLCSLNTFDSRSSWWTASSLSA